MSRKHHSHGAPKRHQPQRPKANMRSTGSLGKSLLDVQALFAAYDRNGDGQVTLEELRRIWRALGDSRSDSEMKRAIRTMDTDNSGFVDMTEFISFMSRSDVKAQKHAQRRRSTPTVRHLTLSKAQVEAFRTVFNKIDTTRQGVISLKKMRRAFTRMGYSVDTKQWLSLLQSVGNIEDLSDDAEVGFEVFVRVLGTHMERCARGLTNDDVGNEDSNSQARTPHPTSRNLESDPVDHSAAFKMGTVAAAERYRQQSLPRAKAYSKNKTASGKRKIKYLEYPIWSVPIERFSNYGLGTLLYFRFLKNLTKLFLLMTLIAFPAFIFCFSADERMGSETGYFFEKGTLGNIGLALQRNTSIADIKVFGKDTPKTEIATIMSLFDVLYCIVFLLFCWFVEVSRQTATHDYNQKEIKVTNFTVEVTGLPTNFTNRDRIRLADYFEGLFGPVQDVAISHGDHEIIELYRRRGEYYKLALGDLAKKDDDRFDYHTSKMMEFDNKLQHLDVDLEEYAKKCTGAYVTFQHQESALKCLATFQPTWWDRCRNGNRVVFEGDRLIVNRAEEPSNILYVNLGFTHKEIFWRRMWSSLATIILVGISASIVYVAQLYQVGQRSDTVCPNGVSLEEALSGDDYLHDCWCYRQGTSVVTQSAVDCSAWLSDYLLTRTLVLISVFTIVLVNFVLKELIRVLGRYERHHTLSREQSSVTVKMFIGMFINTGLILLLVNANFQHLAGSETAFGLFFDGAYQDFVTEWFLSVGISLCLTIFINMFTPHLYPVLYIPLGWLRRQCCVQKNATQDELNKLFDGEKFDLAERYAAILNTIFVVLFYSSGMPIVLLMGALTFFFAFWFDKLSFLRLYKIPPRYDSSLAKLTIEICPIAVVLHLMLGMWFYTCPILTTDVYDANNTVKLVADSLQGYNVWGFGERLISGGSLPLLILAITMILIKFLLVFFGEVVLCGRCKFDCLERVQIKKNAVYMTYQQATQYVHMESYHVHNAPYYEAAFIKIPGRPHLTGEPTLSLLRHAQTETKKAATQAGVVIDMNAQHRYDRKQQHGNVVPPGAFATRSTGGPVTPRSPRSQTSWASPRTSPRVSPRASPRGSPKGGSRGSPSFSPKRPPLSPRQGRKPQQPRKTLSNTQPSSKITSISYGGTPPSRVKHIQSQPPKHPPVKTGPSRGSYKPGNVRPR